MIISGLYLILFIISIISTFLVIDRIINRRISYYTALFILITIVCLAYFSYSIAADKGMALVSNQFTFLDGTFVLMFFLFCVMDICEIKVENWLSIPLTVINLFFIGCVFTVEYNHLLYSYYDYSTDFGASHLITELGPVFNLYVAYVIILMLIPMSLVTYSAFRRKKISYKYIIAMGTLLAAIVAIFFIENYFGTPFDLLPIGYVLMELVLLVLLKRMELYDFSKLAVTTNEANMELGCIVFDTDLRFVGANNVAKYYFPELETLDIDRKVTNPFVISEFVNWLHLYIGGTANKKIYTRKDRKIVCEIKPYVRPKTSKLQGYLIEIQDNTEQQNFIEKLNQINDELAIAVDDANNANSAKSLFLASMSHEIRTPINAIIGMNEIAMKECKQNDLLEYLESIDNASTNLLSLINDILDFSKIEAGKIDIIEAEYNSAKLIRDVKDIISFKADANHINFIVNIAKDFPSKLYGDENRIRQVIINILNNAVKYTPKGSVTLSMSFLRTDEPENNNLFIIEIVDTGIGIKEEDLSNLFKSFTRFDNTKNRNIEGTGLGLAITERLVKNMGGNIEVKSTYGVGSTFTITIPQKIIDATPMKEIKEAPKQSLQDISNEYDFTGRTFLIVDDNTVNLKVTTGLLKYTNASVDTASSGLECLKKLAKNHYDIVFLDHMMPDMDGIETLTSAKNELGWLLENTVFVALTANAISGAREEYISAGFDGYLTKPIKSAELYSAINTYLA